MITPFTTTGIGSLPHTDVDSALNLIFKYTDIVFWPQLPRRSPFEQMIHQYSEGLPGLTIQRDSILIDPSEEQINQFYEQYLKEQTFPISRASAEGFYRFIEILSDKSQKIVKGQVTGPVTLALSLKFKDGRAVYYNEEYREILLMLLKGKTRWQIQSLSQIAEKVVIFIDEPILTALGSSSYLSVSTQEAMRLIEELVKEIKQLGATAGIHCCGRADWAQVVHTGVDILNFDAYQFFESLKASAEMMDEFLSRGGLLAWGIVPSTEKIINEDKDSLLKRFDLYIKELKPFISEEKILNGSILTPSCGLGSRTIEEAEKTFVLLHEMAEALK